MGILNWLDPELDNSLGNILTGIAKGNSIFGGIVDGMRANREDEARKKYEAIWNKLGMAPQGMDMRPATAPNAPLRPVEVSALPDVSAPPRSPMYNGVDLSGAFSQAERANKLPGGLLTRMAQIESGMNPKARNPSGATGLLQFMPATAKQYDVNPLDPNSSIAGAGRLAADNARMLRNALGREPTAGELYLAHQQGATGAIKLLTNPQAMATQVVGAPAVLQNGGNPNMTASDFASKWIDKFTSGMKPMNSSQPLQPSGQTTAFQMNDMALSPQDNFISPFAGTEATAPQPQKMPGAEIPTADLIAIVRDPNAPQEDKTLAMTLLQPRLQAPARVDPLDQMKKAAEVQKLLAEASKGPDLPASVQEYNFAVSQGYKGGFTDFQQQKAKAGATNVTIDQGGDRQFEKEMATGLAKTFTGLMDQGREAVPQLMDIGVLRDALKQSPQGFAGGMASLAQSFGVDVTGKGAPQVVDAIVAKLVPAQRPPGSGPMSDRDVLLFRSSLPSLWGTPQGNQIIVDAMESMAKYKIDAGRVAERIALGEITREDGLRELRQLADPLARFKAFQTGGGNRTTSGVEWSVKK